jgi:membrane-associated phospholipid phosphatase
MQFLHLFELDLIKHLQLIRTPILDKFFLFLNLFDTFYFPLILIPIVWMVNNWKWGLKLLYLIILSYIVNEFAKNIFGQPRPYNLDHNVGLVFFKSYGFPSGAVQSATIYAGLLISYLKNKKLAWISSINIIFWLGLSRVYLGVHFISDLVGGFILGFLVILLFNYFSPKAQIFLSKRSIFALYLINLLFCFCIFLLEIPFAKEMSFSCFLVGVGLILSKQFNVLLPFSRSIVEGLSKLAIYFLGIVLHVLLVFNFLPFHSKDTLYLISAACMGIWLSFGINIVWVKGFYNLRFFKK